MSGHLARSGLSAYDDLTNACVLQMKMKKVKITPECFLFTLKAKQTHTTCEHPLIFFMTPILRDEHKYRPCASSLYSAQ